MSNSYFEMGEDRYQRQDSSCSNNTRDQMIYAASVLIYAERFRELITGVINSYKHGA